MSRGHVALLYLVVFAGFGAFFPYVGPHLVERGFGGAATTGLLICFPLAALVSPPLTGILADAGLGRRRVAPVALGLALVAIGVLGWVRSPWLLFPALACVALGQSPQSSMLDAACLDHLREHGGSYGRLRLFGSLGFLAGVLAAGPVIDAWGPRGFIGLNLVLAAAGVGVLSTLPGGRMEARDVLGSIRRLVGRPGMLPLGVATVLHVAAGAGYAIFFGVLLDDLGVARPMTWTAAGWFCGVVCEIGFFVVSSAVLRRTGVRVLLLIAFGGGVVRWGLTAALENPLLLAGVQSLHALVYAAFWTAAVHVIDRASPPDLRTGAQGILVATSFGTGNAVGYLLHGQIYDLLGGAGVFGAGAAIDGLALLVGLLFVSSNVGGGNGEERDEGKGDPGGRNPDPPGDGN